MAANSAVPIFRGYNAIQKKPLHNDCIPPTVQSGWCSDISCFAKLRSRGTLKFGKVLIKIATHYFIVQSNFLPA
jgi:hypothetical protein